MPSPLLLQHSQERPTPSVIWNLTWPQMLMMFLTFCTGIINVWTAGRLGGDIQAAFGVVTQCVFLLQVVVMALSGGALAAVSQSLGAGKLQRAQRYAGLVTLGSALLGLGMALPAWYLRTPFFALLGVPDSLIPVTHDYWRILLYTLPAQYVFVATGMLFRASRQVFPPLWVALFTVVCTVGGNLGFGLGFWGLPACGYQGIAWTNFVTVSLGSALHCLLLYQGGLLRRDSLPGWRWVRQASPYLLRVALPSGGSQLIWQGGYIVLFTIVASLPHGSVTALAGLTAGLRMEALLFLPGMAFSMTASVLVGNALGAQRPQEARRLALLLGGCGCAFLSIMALLLWPFQQTLAAILSDLPDVQEQIVSYLRYNFLAAPFSALSMILGGAMTGAGATRFNLIVFGCAVWCVRLPLGWLLGHHLWENASGVFAAMLISQILQASAMLYVLIRCHWTAYSMRAPK